MGVIKERAKVYTQEERLLEARHESDLGNIITATLSLPATAFATAFTGGFTFGQASGISAAIWAMFKEREVTYTHTAFNEKLKNAEGEEKDRLKQINRSARKWRWAGNAIFAAGEAVTATLAGLAPFSAALSLYPATITGPWSYGIRGVFLDRENAAYKKAFTDEVAALPKRRFPFIYSQVR